MTLPNWLPAWIRNLFQKSEVKTVADETQVAGQAIDPVQPVSAPTVVPTVDLTVLKGILKALGHDLDVVWADAVALAKKVG